jgi:prepilin-type N-terminal cleavage/methylation domain-containing protein/prepilin-type processing-associated H-X9-DG protein
MNVHRQRTAFSLIELLVVISIIAVLVALLIPAIQKVRDAANRAGCLNNLRQIGLALHAYHDTARVFPPGVSYQNGTSPYPFLSWNARILPFLEQNDLWLQIQQAFAKDRNFLDVPPHTNRSTVVSVFTCPADDRTQNPSTKLGGLQVAFTAFLGIGGSDYIRKDGILFLDSHVRLGDIKDGSSNTLIVGERPPSADEVLGWWYAGWGQSKDGSAEMVLGVREFNVHDAKCWEGPYSYGPGGIDNQCDAYHFWSLHSGGAHFLFADGSARLLGYDAVSVMPALASRAGGETVSLP